MAAGCDKRIVAYGKEGILLNSIKLLTSLLLYIMWLNNIYVNNAN